MQTNLPIFLFSHQPTTCPHCGNRTEIRTQSTEPPYTQEHYCQQCKFHFLQQEEE